MVQALKKKMKNEKGFTLIELLAVIVILGIIAAIAVPSIMGIINKSKNDAKVAEAIQIIDAAKLSHASHSDATTWTDDGANSSVALHDSLEHVQNTDYIVTLTATGDYEIKTHPACDIVTGKDANGYVTEQDLLNYTK